MDRLPRTAFCLLAALAATAGCDRAPAPRAAPGSGGRPNVLILSIDTLRADHLGCYGYAPYPQPVSPRIDQFAKESLLFEHCFAPRGQTGPSLTSMLTGCYPSRHGVLDNFQPLRPEVATLAQCFGAAGYATHAFLSFLPLPKPTKAQLGFERGDPRLGSWFEARPHAPNAPQALWDDAAEQRLEQFLARRARDDAPFFAWAHFYDVHQPYRAPPPHGDSFVGEYRGPLRLAPDAGEADFDRVVKRALDARMVARAPLEPDDARYVVALYDGGIRATDERIGRILRALDEAKLAQETIVVLTADHGEELGDHGAFWFHGNSVYDSVLRIPLIVRGPGIPPARYGELIQNVDLLPTLLTLVGAPLPAPIDGIAFAAELHGARTDAFRRQYAWSEWQHLILGVRSDRWKVVLNPRGAHPKKPPYDAPDDRGFFVDCHELYDVAADPHESRNLWSERKGEIALLRELAEKEYERRFGALGPGATETTSDPQELERMRSLGYGGGAESGAADYLLDPESCRDD